MKARLKGQIIAQSDSVIVFQGETYFPRNSLRDEFFRESPDNSQCFLRGTAKHWDLIVEGELFANGATSFDCSRPNTLEIKDMVLFNENIVLD